MRVEDYACKFIVFDDKDEFVAGCNKYQDINSYPDNYLVYSHGNFLKHVKEFKKLDPAKLKKWDEVIESVNMSVFMLFC